MIERGSARARLALAARALSLAQCLLLLTQCTSQPAPAASNPTAGPPLTPVLSVKELMEHVIDPTADWIFDAAVIDVTAKGVKTTVPITDEDWLRVERGAMLLAEASNLLKMPRAMAPAGAAGSTPLTPGEPAPELSPAEIEARVNANRDLWNKHADELRTVALASLTVVKARNVDGLFQIGSDIDKACENCHLEFWYPGDKEAVLADQKKKVTYGASTPKSQPPTPKK
jgi:hypothetical protein